VSRARAARFGALADLVPDGAGPGLVLMASAAAALILANSPLGGAYADLWHRRLGPLDLRHWIDDALMALFFFSVGLEVKREVAVGALATRAARRVPIVAAACGMAAPALVYLAVSGFAPALARGWAIPAATDIAFALGVLSLLGRRVPPSLRLFLTSVAVADDIGAVAIIALAYTDALDARALAAAAAILAGLWGLNRGGVRALWPYMLLAAALWLAVYLSGVHATVAGVLAALFVPLGRDDRRPLEAAEHALAPWIAYGVLPLFGLANAGVSLAGAALFAPLPLAVTAGLFVGKQAGVFAAVRLMAATGLGRPPEGASWAQLYGVSLLAGIGFTMSLFIGGLAFADPAMLAQVKLGVLAGSALSAVAGVTVLRLAGRSTA
jgi:NhaA family Na+:H+ antiporter